MAEQSQPQPKTGPSLSGRPGMWGTPCVMSGRPLGFISGRPAGASGRPMNGAEGDWEAFAIGNGVGQASSIPFELAPRLYMLSCESSASAGNGSPANSSPLPVQLAEHLIFRELPGTNAERSRFKWSSEESGNGVWELVVEKRDGTVEATLTVSRTKSESGAGSLTWKVRGAWDPFGANRLDPEFGSREAPSLIVAAL